MMSPSIRVGSGAGGRVAPGIAAGEDAAAEEGSFQSVVAVITPAAEARHLTGRIKSGNGCAGCVEHLAAEIGVEATQRLASEDVQPHRDQRAVGGVEDAVRFGCADKLVAEIGARAAYCGHLCVLGEGIFDLAVSGLDLC